MAEQQKLDSHAIELVTALATEGTAPSILHITTSGLGAGLPSSLPVAFDRKSQAFKSVKGLVEEFRDAPARRKGTASTNTLASFIDLVNRHKDADSVLFGKTSWPEPKLTAVLDYDREGVAARNRGHRVVYTFPLTDEFKAWVNGSAKPMDQESFAAFIEEHAAELAAPFDGERSTYEPLFKETMATPSDVLSLSRHLEVMVSAKAKQGIRLQTGERTVEFTEEHQNAKGEKVVIPGIFMVSVPAFVDGDPVRIPARLRYRIAGGDIKWFYQLYRWEFFLREQVGFDLKQAADGTGLPSFEGAPES
ncbi:YfdQ family protein [Aminobacter sp. NyZ550]|uniref:YfdQ family protein n=1 Tax=Aminobacter sp. NyZ550 TaxID=2979870 RepID=UPI0021D56CDD|nr:YfdQ family protein [Aminobacter sp. NyZ550]WAX93172.1 YfdQ family protein [Aminobacter sp. NyZ550]